MKIDIVQLKVIFYLNLHQTFLRIIVEANDMEIQYIPLNFHAANVGDIYLLDRGNVFLFKIVYIHTSKLYSMLYISVVPIL